MQVTLPLCTAMMARWHGYGDEGVLQGLWCVSQKGHVFSCRISQPGLLPVAVGPGPVTMLLSAGPLISKM